MNMLSDALKEPDKASEALPTLLLGLSWPAAILLIVVVLLAELRDRLSAAGLDPGKMLSVAARATKWQDLGAQLAFRDRFKEALTEVTDALDQRSLTIVIDDLDRCRPDQIAEVLEAINFFTDADGCFVVFGFARPQVLAGIALAHREIAAELAGGSDTEGRGNYAEDFLRKLIQIEIPVPQFGDFAALKLINAAAINNANRSNLKSWISVALGAIVAFWLSVGVWLGAIAYERGIAAWNAPEPLTASLPAEKPTANQNAAPPPALCLRKKPRMPRMERPRRLATTIQVRRYLYHTG